MYIISSYCSENFITFFWFEVHIITIHIIFYFDSNIYISAILTFIDIIGKKTIFTLGNYISKTIYT